MSLWASAPLQAKRSLHSRRLHDQSTRNVPQTQRVAHRVARHLEQCQRLGESRPGKLHDHQQLPRRLKERAVLEEFPQQRFCVAELTLLRHHERQVELDDGVRRLRPLDCLLEVVGGSGLVITSQRRLRAARCGERRKQSDAPPAASRYPRGGRPERERLVATPSSTPTPRSC